MGSSSHDHATRPVRSAQAPPEKREVVYAWAGRLQASIQFDRKKPIHARGVTERQSDGRARPPAAGTSPAHRPRP